MMRLLIILTLSASGAMAQYFPSGSKPTGVVLSGSVDPGVPVVTIVQSAQSADGASSLAFTRNVTAGNLLMVAAGAAGVGGVTLPVVVSDTLGCSPWVQKVNAQNGSSDMSAILTCVTASSGADTVSITGATSNFQIIVAEISGNFTAATDTSGTAFGSSPPTLTLGYTYDLLFTVVFGAAGDVTVTSPEVVIQRLLGGYYRTILSYVMVPTAGAATSSMTGLVATRAWASLALIAAIPKSPGNNGDWYMNTTTGVLWGPKTGGVWSIANLTVTVSGALGHSACWNGTVLSYCTSVVAADGTCTCH